MNEFSKPIQFITDEAGFVIGREYIDEPCLTKKKYKVIKGIFSGYEFFGFELNGRILDNRTTGRSYPKENCVKI